MLYCFPISDSIHIANITLPLFIPHFFYHDNFYKYSHNSQYDTYSVRYIHALTSTNISAAEQHSSVAFDCINGDSTLSACYPGLTLYEINIKNNLIFNKKPSEKLKIASAEG